MHLGLEGSKSALAWLSLLVLAMFGLTLSAQTPLPPAIRYTASVDSSVQELPLQRWVLRETGGRVDVATLLGGDTSGVTLMPLPEDGMFDAVLQTSLDAIPALRALAALGRASMDDTAPAAAPPEALPVEALPVENDAPTSRVRYR